MSPPEPANILSMDKLCILLRSDNEVTVNHALEYLMLMTQEVDNPKSIHTSRDVIKEIIAVSEKHKNDATGKTALNVIINITAVEVGANTVYELDTKKPVLRFLKKIGDKGSALAEHSCKILANMTIPEKLASRIAEDFLNDQESFRLAFEALHNKNYNTTGCSLGEYLSQCFGNLAQSRDFQKYLLTAENGNLFCSILPILCNGETSLQKRGIASTVYNCLFDVENHPVLLNKPFDILPYLLLPIAGPEEFDDEDNEQLPVELQYLEDTKERESDPEIRTLILKSLLMLCVTKFGREYLRSKQAYLILREYHKWEENPTALLACENVVDVLIRTEDEIGVDNLKNVVVPSDLIEKFEKMDRDFINNS